MWLLPTSPYEKPKPEPVSRLWADSMTEAHLELLGEFDILKSRVAQLEAKETAHD